MTSDAPDRNETDVHEELAKVAAFLRRALRYWLAPVAALLLGVIASAAFLFFKKPTYRSETVILYSEGIRQGEGEDSRDAARGVSTRLKEILTSRSELRKMVDEFHLYPAVAREHGAGDAVEELRRHVEFKAPGGDTFSIAFEGSSPSEAKRVTERLAQIVIEQDGSLRKKQALVTRDFLELEKMGTESRLRDAEQALAAFMAAHPRFALDATPLAGGAAIRATMGGASAPAPPNSPNAMPFVPRPRAPATSSAVASGRTDIAVGTTAREAAEERNRAEAALDAAQARLTDLQARFTPQYPDVRNAQAEVDRAKARLAAAAVNQGSGDARPAGAPPTGGGPVAAPGRAPARVLIASGPLPPRSPEDEKNLVALETDWVKLTRSVTEARQHQDHLEAALFKADMAANSEVGGHGVQVSVIDPAYLPERPVPPGRSTIVALILAAALALGVLGSLLGAAFDDRIYDRRELTTLAPVLVSVPTQLLGRARG
jgi:capsular polysaccharide biosynthesis protein